VFNENMNFTPPQNITGNNFPNTQPVKNKKDDKLLISHCSKLYAMASSKQPKDRLKMCQEYYLGRFDLSQTYVKNNDSYNLINPIVETKTSLTLDSQRTTSVNAVIGSLADLNELANIQEVSDAMNDILDHIKRVNKFDKFGRDAVNCVIKNGIAIGRVSWDQDSMQGIGEVKIDLVDPINFFPDPGGASISDCNFVTIKNKYSAITLKKRYPDRIEDIDKLLKEQSEKDAENKGADTSDRPVVTYANSNAAAQVYVSDNGNLTSLSQSITVYECYLRDDSTFIPPVDNNDSDTVRTVEIGFKYPYGRVVIYAGEDCVFEDKAIEIPTGIPIVTMNLYNSGDIWGQGDVEKLKSVQDRVNRAYKKIQILVGGFISTVLIDELAGITNENEFVNKLITMVETGILPSKAPIVLTNNTLSEIRNLTDLIIRLKEEAKEIARVNDMMISGQSKDPVSSGRMVDSLNESPMSAIREIQEIYYQFLVDVSNYSILVAQSFYNIPRIVRMTNGKTFLSLTPAEDGVPGTIQQLEVDEDTKKINIIKEIKGDLSLTEFECEISTGRNLPRSRGAVAALSMDLWKSGAFGPPESPLAREILLEHLDFPNIRAILQKMRASDEAQSQLPPPPPPIDKVSVAFSDLPIDSQMELLVQNGLIPDPEQNIGQQLPMDIAT
jgi:hypothetical protein